MFDIPKWSSWGGIASECAFYPQKNFFSNFFGPRQRLSPLHDGRDRWGAGKTSVRTLGNRLESSNPGCQCDPAGDLFGLHHHSIHHRSSSTSLVTPNLCPNDYQQACDLGRTAHQKNSFKSRPSPSSYVAWPCRCFWLATVSPVEPHAANSHAQGPSWPQSKTFWEW